MLVIRTHLARRAVNVVVLRPGPDVETSVTVDQLPAVVAVLMRYFAAYHAAQSIRTELTYWEEPRSTPHHCELATAEDQRVVEELSTALPAS